ncbi:hypothetical protein PR048_011441 [Dryococelus australis]|uniref:Uncharacterized protein n=1 Tax=Dryococelus australis TaxID=614101 RepID=A0ABQ9HLR8_9NEOP|nr:hypothetical protein PR048_011441 [Dryococelus australis]
MCWCWHFIRNVIKARVLSLSPNEYQAHPKYLLIDMRLNNQNLLSGVVYNSPFIAYTDHIEAILSPHIACYDHYVLMGYFNRYLFKSNNKISFPMRRLKLHILPLNATYLTCTISTCLNLVIVSNEDKVVNYGQLEAPGLSHHDLLYLSFSLSSSKDIKNIKTQKLLSAADDLPWQCVAAVATVDEKVDILNKLVLNLYDEFALVVTECVTHSSMADPRNLGTHDIARFHV